MKIAIIGASKNRDKYSNKAVRAYKEEHHVVFPVNPNEREIEGLKCYTSVKAIPLDVDVASIYLPPEIGIKVIDEVIEKGVAEVYLNPGSASEEIIKKLADSKVDVKQICSIRNLGKDPGKI